MILIMCFVGKKLLLSLPLEIDQVKHFVLRW